MIETSFESTDVGKSSRSEEVRDKLRQAILSGELRPNERLVETQLAKKLGVSRTPIREALKQLTLQGYISKFPKRGLVVTDHSPSQVRNLYEVRQVLETGAIQLACKRASKEQLDKAAEYHAHIIEMFDSRDVDKFIELDNAFHSELLAACGNEQLWSLIQFFRDQYFDRRLMRLLGAAEWRNMLWPHERLLNAIRNKNVRLAEKLVRQSLERSMRFALERL